ncbi:MAG: hypothetical protein AAGF12_15355 [Myxococcota bacterium]
MNRWMLIAGLALGCGGASTAEPGATTSSTTTSAESAFSSDPERARAFQAPLDGLARPLDRALADVLSGAPPGEVLVGFAPEAPESFADAPAIAERLGATRLEVGGVSFRVVILSDRGPPDADRYERRAFDGEALRVGGIWYFQDALGLFERLAEPHPPTATPDGPARELERAIGDALIGPGCRAMPLLAPSGLEGVVDSTVLDGWPFPDERARNTVCTMFWGARDDGREVELSLLQVHFLDQTGRILGRYELPLSLRADGGLALGEASFGPLEASGQGTP